MTSDWARKMNGKFGLGNLPCEKDAGLVFHINPRKNERYLRWGKQSLDSMLLVWKRCVTSALCSAQSPKGLSQLVPTSAHAV